MTTTAQEVSRLLGGVVPFDDLEAEYLATVFTWHATPDWDRGELASVRWWSMGELAQADDRCIRALTTSVVRRSRRGRDEMFETGQIEPGDGDGDRACGSAKARDTR